MAVHQHDLGFGHAQFPGDCRHPAGRQRSIVHRLDLGLQPPQVEEQLLAVLVGHCPDQRRRPQHVVADRRANPPHRIGGETKTTFVIELVHRLHQADVALRDEVAEHQSVPAILAGDLDHQPLMAADELFGGLRVAPVAPAPGQFRLGLLVEKRKLPDIPHVPSQGVLGRRTPALQRQNPVHLKRSSPVLQCT